MMPQGFTIKVFDGGFVQNNTKMVGDLIPKLVF